MRRRLKGLLGRLVSVLQANPQSGLFSLLAVASLIVLLMLARHTSAQPRVLGRWSTGFSGLLALQTSVTLALAVLCIPLWRARLLRRSVWSGSRNGAWALVVFGLAALPVLHQALRMWLLVENGAVQVILASLVAIALAALIWLLLWRTGISTLTVQARIPLVLLLLFFGQLLVTANHLGKVPRIDIDNETRLVGDALRLFVLPDSFIQLEANRNANTWIDFRGFGVFTGAWMSLAGAGILQIRLFHLLVAWAGIAFMSLAAYRLSGVRAAFITAICGIVLPLHYVIARADVWVATASSIAFCCFVFAKDPGAGRARLLAFACGFFATSATDGHPYGIAFLLMFGVLNLEPLVRLLRGAATAKEVRRLSGFLAGCLCYLVLWFCFHIALPGISLSSIPNLLQSTMEFETGLGAAGTGTGLNIPNFLRYVQHHFYYNPYAIALSLAALIPASQGNFTTTRHSLTVAGGAGILILLFLAHFTPHYLVFWVPFMCLWIGIGLSRLDSSPNAPASRHKIQISLGTVYVLSALVLLGVVHLGENSSLHQDSFERFRNVTRTSQEINGMLPAEDVVVAGTIEMYIGMPWRLNFGGSCGFTRGDTVFWPLDPPQAVIHTPVWDRGCDQLADWLKEHDFRPARCFTGHDLGEGVTILYLSPELMTPESAVDCTPAQLALLEETA